MFIFVYNFILHFTRIFDLRTTHTIFTNWIEHPTLFFFNFRLFTFYLNWKKTFYYFVGLIHSWFELQMERNQKFNAKQVITKKNLPFSLCVEVVVVVIIIISCTHKCDVSWIRTQIHTHFKWPIGATETIMCIASQLGRLVYVYVLVSAIHMICICMYDMCTMDDLTWIFHQRETWYVYGVHETDWI